MATVDKDTLDIFKDADALPRLRPFPLVGAQLIAASDNPSSTAKTFAAIIQTDPALTLRLLDIANSTMFAARSEIASVERAVVVLGFNAVRDLAVALAGAQLFKSDDEMKNDRAALWEHSLGCAVVARLLAQDTRSVMPEEAFLAGIFHDVGKLLFYELAPIEFRCITLSNNGGDAGLSEERRAFDTTHESMGQICAENWGLSPDVVLAIGNHHRSDKATFENELARITCVANLLAKSWCIGSDVVRGTDSDNLGEQLLSIDEGLNLQSLQDIRELAQASFEDAKTVSTR